jgi:hypothetical protein
VSRPRPDAGPSRHNNQLWHLTPERMAHINACAAQNRALSNAAREIGVHPATLKAAAIREGKLEWLQSRFNTCKVLPQRPEPVGGLRQVARKQIATPQGVATKWLTGQVWPQEEDDGCD